MKRTACPLLTDWPELPIVEKRLEIESAVREHSVVVVCGDTGSGKSTQLPKFCLELGRGIAGMIGHTQPRRIAARSIAARLAAELGTSVGRHVGYQVRFQDVTSPETLVKLMTDGILLAETQTDRFLERYDTIILDEVHERSLNIDYLIGYLGRLLVQRADLRLIVTSATIDARRFADHFREQLGPRVEVPVFEVSGRSYPVEVRYRPVACLDREALEEPSPAGAEHVADLVEELLLEGPGDMLVFLPTEREIRELSKLLRGRPAVGVCRAEILPLYARLPATEQQRVFSVSGRRRVVLTTNVAESSLTVPGIRYVVDTGTARIGRYSPRTKVQRLPIEPVSRASADQRKGRCGRLGPGICVRAYSEDDYLAREAFTTPEIRRTNLAGAILRMLALDLGEIETFPLMDRPRPEAIRDGYHTLFELGATDGHRRLTELGRRLSKLPVDPRISRMILAAADEQSLAEVLIIASALEIQDPRERPLDKQAQADAAHAHLADGRSDFLTLLNLWDFFWRLREQLSHSKLRLACRQNFLSLARLHEWVDLHRQLRQLVEQAGYKLLPRRNDPDTIHRALLSGLLANVALRGDNHEYQGAGGGKFFLWPGSALFDKRPLWVVGAELIETSKRYLRTVAEIRPEWLETLAAHLVRRSYSDPHWSRRSGTVLAYEKVSLFGLPVVARRRRPYAQIDPKIARRLFIEHALVDGDYDCPHGFLMANQQLVRDLENRADRTRRREYIIGSGVVYAFYQQNLPQQVVDAASLDRWLRPDAARRESTLRMAAEDLIGKPAAEDDPGQFPQTLSSGSMDLSIDYRFEPGAPHDGMTVTVPEAGLHQLAKDQLDWAVPGLLEEKLVALIRSLPKGLRRRLIPAPDVARQAAERLEFGQGNFLAAVAAAFSRLSGERIGADAFQLDKVPDHLKVNLRVVDDAGQIVAQGRDVESLKRQFAPTQVISPTAVPDLVWDRQGIARWDFGEIPERIEVRRGGVQVSLFPALADRRDSVAQVVLADQAAAAWETRRAIQRLLTIVEKKALRSQVNWLPGLIQWQITLNSSVGPRASVPRTLERYAALPSPPAPGDANNTGPVTDLKSSVTDLLAARLLEDVREMPRCAEQFEAVVVVARERLAEVVQEITTTLDRVFQGIHQVKLQLADLRSLAGRMDLALEDIEEQLARLTPGGFLAHVPWRWLQHYPRYLQAIIVRCEKLKSGSAAKDQQAMEIVGPRWRRLWNEVAQLPEHVSQTDPWLELRWTLEELRVSAFAQQLGTAHKVSAQRLDKLWQEATGRPG